MRIASKLASSLARRPSGIGPNTKKKKLARDAGAPFRLREFRSGISHALVLLREPNVII